MLCVIIYARSVFFFSSKLYRLWHPNVRSHVSLILLDCIMWGYHLLRSPCKHVVSNQFINYNCNVTKFPMILFSVTSFWLNFFIVLLYVYIQSLLAIQINQLTDHFNLHFNKQLHIFTSLTLSLNPQCLQTWIQPYTYIPPQVNINTKPICIIIYSRLIKSK